MCSWKLVKRLQIRCLPCFERPSLCTFSCRSLSWKLGHIKSLRSATVKSWVFCVLLSPNSGLCSMTSICPQSPNPNHSGAALTTTASLKKKHDQHYLYKDRQQQQQQQVCPCWLRGALQNEKSVFSSLISPHRGHEAGWTLKTDEQVNSQQVLIRERSIYWSRSERLANWD